MYIFQVSDMSCAHCVASVEQAVKSVDGAARVTVNLAAARVSVDSHQPPALIAQAIADAGYKNQLHSEV